MLSIKSSFYVICTLLILCSLFSCTSRGTIEPGQAIQIESGLVSGVAGTDPNITVFKGIPFAAPPVGELRWQAPQPPLSWEGVRKANEYCNSCVQTLTRRYMPWTEEYMLRNDVDEDCLGLNIWTAAKNQDEKRAVLVYIHGGAYTGGSGEVVLYNGEKLASKGIVVVTVNYRLGVFGFFAHPELTKESENSASGNYGLLDHIAALKWIKHNINAFGGDPDNITIAGQSAGAASVNYLTASPLAKGLFHKAIAQSGPWNTNRDPRNLSYGEQQGVAFTDSVGAKSLYELRSIPADKLLALSNEFQFRFSPVYDEWMLPEGMVSIFEKGMQNDVPMLMGLNADERSSSPTYGKITKDKFVEDAMNKHGEMADQFLQLYPAKTDNEAGEFLKQSMRDAGLANMLKWEAIRTDKGQATDYLYFFDRTTPWPEFPQYGTFHSSEIPYVFYNQHLIDRPWEEIDHKLARMMSNYWVNFINSGDPNGEGLPAWSSETEMIMHFDENPKSETILSEEKKSFYLR